MGIIAIRERFLTGLGIPQPMTGAYLTRHGALEALATLGLRAPAVAVIGIALIRYPHGALRAALRIEGRVWVAWTAVITVISTFVLNAFGLWPLTWRWASNSAISYVAVLRTAHDWPALSTWVFSTVIVAPIAEEIIFRFALLQAIAKWTKSGRAGVFVSSIAFSLAHVGYLPPDVPHLVNSAWLFIASVVLARITLARGGSIGVSLTAHMSRNFIEVLTLLTLT